jgi:hypothetical protein
MHWMRNWRITLPYRNVGVGIQYIIRTVSANNAIEELAEAPALQKLAAVVSKEKSSIRG